MDKHLNGLQKFLSIIRGRVENKICLTLVAGGIGIIGASVGTDWFQIVLVFLYKIFNVDSVIPDGGETIIGVSAGGCLVVLGVVFYFKVNKPLKNKQVARIEHASIEVADFSRIPEEKNTATVVYKIDQVDNMRHLTDVGLRSSLFSQKQEVQKILNRYQYDDVRPEITDYYGLAHIPFTVLLGYQIADKVNMRFHEWDQNKGTWVRIGSKPVSYPKMLLKTTIVQTPINVEDVILKISMTTSIEDGHLEGLGLENLDTYDLRLENPERNHIVSLQQLQKYKKIVRDTLDKINRTYPGIKKIHLFYSGQMSFAYCLGSTFSQRMDPQIFVYNHVFGGTPKYNWVLPLKKVHETVEAKLTQEVVVDNV